jgi:hypothetical protein
MFITLLFDMFSWLRSGLHELRRHKAKKWLAEDATLFHCHTSYMYVRMVTAADGTYIIRLIRLI